MLNLISQALDPHLVSLGLSSARIDGQSSLQNRRNTLERFNSDKDCVVILATIGAVGEGYVFLSSSIIPCFHIQLLASLKTNLSSRTRQNRS